MTREADPPAWSPRPPGTDVCLGRASSGAESGPGLARGAAVPAERPSPPPAEDPRVRVRRGAPPAGPSQEAGASPGLPDGGDLNPGTWPRRLTEALRSQWSRGSLPGGHNSRRWLRVRGGGTAGGGVPRARAWRCPGARVRDGELPRRGSGPRRGRSLRQRPRQAEEGEEERAGSPSLHLPSAARTAHWPKPRGRGRAGGLGDTVPAVQVRPQQTRPGHRCCDGDSGRATPCGEEARSPSGRRTGPSRDAMAVSPRPPPPARGGASQTSGHARAERHPYSGPPRRAGSLRARGAGLSIVPGLALPRPPRSQAPVPTCWTSPSFRSPACSVTRHLPQRTHAYRIPCWEFTRTCELALTKMPGTREHVHSLRYKRELGEVSAPREISCRLTA